MRQFTCKYHGWRLTGATAPEQVNANIAAASWGLDEDELAAVAEALSAG